MTEGRSGPHGQTGWRPSDADPDLERLIALANLMDNRFRIPGTTIRFGLDAIIGLIPYVGDIAGLLIGAYIMFLVARRGAGPVLLLRMGGNYLVDALAGSIPVLGDMFDFVFKANRRNIELLLRYYASGKPRPNTFVSLLLLILLLFVLLALVLWSIGWMAYSLAGSIFGS